MTNLLRSSASALAGVVLVTGLAACSKDSEAPATSAVPGSVATAPASPAAGSDSALAMEALVGPEGEYAATAAYAAVIERFGPVEPYVSIKAAEDRHVEALVRQLERAGVEVPPNPYVGTIPAPDDLAVAAQAWADGEVANVAMYDGLLARTTDPTLTRVLTNLRRASQDQHLPLFQAAADNGGVLTQDQMRS